MTDYNYMQLGNTWIKDVISDLKRKKETLMKKSQNPNIDGPYKDQVNRVVNLYDILLTTAKKVQNDT